MSESVLCPVCETPNPPDQTNCEVCGERLTPAAPGEVIPEEENMAASLQEQASAPAGGFSYEEEDFQLDPSAAPGESMGHGAVGEPVAFEQPTEQEQPTAGATILYSSLSGEAFGPESQEYKEGFGPMGEPLVDTPPLNHPEEQELAAQEPVEQPAATPPESFEEPGPPVDTQPPAPAPEPRPVLPMPGAFSEPAQLTLYVNRQPVNTHYINTDETLIGRKDVRSDVYPDIDLTDHDTQGFVSRKHAYIYRQNKNYTLYAVSNGGVQLGQELLQLGERRALSDGDVIVIAGILAFRFKMPSS